MIINNLNVILPISSLIQSFFIKEINIKIINLMLGELFVSHIFHNCILFKKSYFLSENY